MKQVGPRISKETESFLTENFRTLNAGAEFCLDTFNILYKKTMHNLKYFFSRDELMLIIDSFNGYAMVPISANSLWWHITESIKYDSLDTKWQVKKEDLQAKIENLDIFTCTAIEIWANGFWYGGDPETKQLNIKKHVAELSA